MARSRACPCAEARSGHPVHLALFDFDHTITTIDTYGRFLRRIATPAELSRARWKIGPWLVGYRMGVISAASLRARVTRFAFTGKSPGEIDAQGARFAAGILPGVLRPHMMQRIGAHRARGDTVVVVSGSLDAYLRPWCERHGLELICNRLEASGGRLTGRYHQGDCGSDKAARIRARYDVAAYPRIHAYGDSREDRGMLALAHHRWYRGRQVA
jgi:HAD superfamily phosphoserine phosphatase-like hydrolase